MKIIFIICLILAIRSTLSLYNNNNSNNKANDQLVLGVDNIDEYSEIFQGKRVGLLTNPTGINKDYESTIDILFKKLNLTCLFSPEHGIRGNAQGGEEIFEDIDERTGLTVYSLYGKYRTPNKIMMDKLDIFLVDLQDSGTRFYTYIYTMANALKACHDFNKLCVVLDRPNPIGGNILDGNLLNEKHSSFIGMYPIITRHGMTIGEIAKLFNYEFEINSKLKIVKMKNYDRTKFYDELNVPWVMLSPNLPTIDSAIVYPGTGHFEGVNLSEGRGTTKPFEYIGAPFIDPFKWSEKLNSLKLPGVHFRPIYFNPTFEDYKGEKCGGVQVHITNRNTFQSVKAAFAMIYTIKELYPQEVKFTQGLKRLSGVDYIYNMDYTLEELFEIINSDIKKFIEVRKKYLLYSEYP